MASYSPAPGASPNLVVGVSEFLSGYQNEFLRWDGTVWTPFANNLGSFGADWKSLRSVHLGREDRLFVEGSGALYSLEDPCAPRAWPRAAKVFHGRWPAGSR